MAARNKRGRLMGRTLTKEQIVQHLRHLGGASEDTSVDLTVLKGKAAQGALFSGDPIVGRERKGRKEKWSVTVAPTLEGLSVASRRIVSQPRDLAVNRLHELLSGPSKSDPDAYVAFPDVYRAIQGAQTAFEASDWYHRTDLRAMFVDASREREAAAESRWLAPLMRVARGDALLPEQTGALARVVRSKQRMIERAVQSGDPVDAMVAATRLTYALRGFVEQQDGDGGDGGDGGEPDKKGKRGEGCGLPGDKVPTPAREQASDLVDAIGHALNQTGYASARVATLLLKEELANAFGDLDKKLDARDDPGTGASAAHYAGVEIVRPATWDNVIASPAIARIVASARGGSGLPPMRSSGSPTRKVWGLAHGITNVFTRPPQSAAHKFILVDDSGSMGSYREAAFTVASAIAMTDPTHSHILAFSTGSGGRLAIAEVPAGKMPPHGTFSGGTPLCVALEYLQQFMAGKLRDSVAVIITDASNGGGVHTGHTSPCRNPYTCLSERMAALAKTGMRYSAIVCGQSHPNFPGVPDERVVGVPYDISVARGSGNKGLVKVAAKALAIVSGNAALSDPRFVSAIIASTEADAELKEEVA